MAVRKDDMMAEYSVLLLVDLMVSTRAAHWVQNLVVHLAVTKVELLADQKAGLKDVSSAVSTAARLVEKKVVWMEQKTAVHLVCDWVGKRVEKSVDSLAPKLVENSAEWKGCWSAVCWGVWMAVTKVAKSVARWGVMLVVEKAVMMVAHLEQR